MRGVPRDRFAISRAPSRIDGDLQHIGRPPDDQVEILDRVVVEPLHDPEARPHRRRQHA
jgi:spore maturation protein CgeB